VSPTDSGLLADVGMCACVCVCVRERETERVRGLQGGEDP